MTEVTTRELLMQLAARPIGGKDISYEDTKEAAARACGVWLPAGKCPASTPESRAARKALKASQIDIEEAVEAAGGARGSMGR